METWVFVSAIVSAVAAVVMAVYSVRLWSVNKLLAQVQAEAEQRNNAILKCEHMGLASTKKGTDRGIRFRIRNSGLKDTHIFDCYLSYAGLSGSERAELRFMWHKRDVAV